MKLLVGLLFVGLLISGCSTWNQYFPNATTQTISPPINYTVTNTTLNSSNTTNITVVPESSVLAYAKPHPGNLTMYVLGVSEGQSILFVTPDNKTFLVDGSTEGNAPAIIRFIKNIGFNELDYVLASSPVKEYYSGLPLIFQKLKPKQTFYSGYPVNSPAFRNYSGTWENVSADHALLVGDFVGVSLMVPYDTTGFDSSPSSATIPFRLSYKDKTFIIMSTCSDNCQNAIDSQLRSANVFTLANGGRCEDNSLYLLSYAYEYAVQTEHKAVCDEVTNKIITAGKTLKSVNVDGTLVFTTDGDRLSFESVSGTV